MDNINGALGFRISGDNLLLRQAIDDSNRRILGLSNTAVQQSQRMDSSFKSLSQSAVRETGKIESSFDRLSKLAIGGLAFSQLAGLPQQLIKVRGEFQSLTIAFTQLLGSKSKADAFLQDGLALATRSPLEFSEIAKGQQLLLSYGVEVKNIISTLERLSDIAAGTGANFNELVAAYGQINTQGTAQWDDITKFLERGVNLVPVLATNLGKADKDIKQFVADGKVGFADIEKAIISLTNGSAKINFGGLGAAKVGTLPGQISALADAYEQALNKIGASSEGGLSAVIGGTTEVVKNYEPILDVLTVLVATYGAYKAAIIAVSVAQTTLAISGNVVAWLQLAASVRSAKDAQIAFNLATSANPYIIAAAALTALAVAVAVYSDELDAAGKAEQALAEVRGQAAAQTQDEVAKIDLLKVAINNEKLSRDQRNKSLQNLIALSPQHLSALTLESIKTGEGTAAINNYIVALKRKFEYQAIDTKLSEAYKLKLAAKNGETDFGLVDTVRQRLFPVKGDEGGIAGYQKGVAEQRKRDNAEIQAEQDVKIDKLLAEKKALDEAGSASVKAEGKTQAAVAKTISYYDDLIEKLNKDRKAASTRPEVAGIDKKIKDAEAARNRLAGEQTKAQQQAAKVAEKVGQAGSVSFWEDQASKAEDALRRIDVASNAVEANRLKAIKENATQQAELLKRAFDAPVGTIRYYEALIADAQKALADIPAGGNPDLIATQQYIITQATEKADEIRKRNALKSFAEELEEKRLQYELYQRYVDAYGKESADAQFADLKKSGASYVDYLSSEINKVEAKKAEGPLTAKDLLNLDSLIGQRNELTSLKKPIEAFTESLDRAKVEAASLTDYLDFLRAKQEQLTPTDFEKRTVVSQRIVTTTNERDDNVRQYLESVTDSEEQVTAIRKRYADLRAGLSKQAAAGMVRDYASQLSQIGIDEQKELDEAKLRRVVDSKEWEALTAKITEEGRKGQAAQIKQLQDRLELLKKNGLKASDEYKKALEELGILEKTKKKEPIEDFKVFASLAGELGQALSAINGTLGETGQLLVGIAGQANLVAEAFKKGITPQEQISVGVQAAASLINILTSSAKQRQEAEEAYYRAVNAEQQQRNILLNDEAVIKAKASQNVFTRDYDKELKANLAKYTDAQAKYRDAIAKLDQGQVKVGQRDAVDWGNVGKGAAAGAALGTIIPGVGNLVGGLVGCAVGALVGLFGGKKRQDEFGSLLKEYPELIQQSADGVKSLNVALATSLSQSDRLDQSTKALVSNALQWQEEINKANETIKSIVGDLAGSLGDSLRNGLVNAFKDGTSAAQAFSSSVSSVLEDLVSKMLFSKTFGPAFDKLQAELTSSLTTGDGNTIDDFEWFAKDAKDSTEAYQKYLAQFKEAAKAAGFDVLKSTNPNTTVLTGGISQIQESTASVIAGQITAMRIENAQISTGMTKAVNYLASIATNTGNVDRNTYPLASKLDEVIKALKSDPLRAAGGPG